jgi:hypothetical protein
MDLLTHQETIFTTLPQAFKEFIIFSDLMAMRLYYNRCAAHREPLVHSSQQQQWTYPSGNNPYHTTLSF